MKTTTVQREWFTVGAKLVYGGAIGDPTGAASVDGKTHTLVQVVKTDKPKADGSQRIHLRRADYGNVFWIDVPKNNEVGISLQPTAV